MNDDWLKSTSIHTRVNQTYRISSIWRHYGNANFDMWAWETIVWKDDDLINYQKSSLFNADVMQLHHELYDKIINGEPYETEESE